jgi:hypothetical protein
MVPLGGNSTPLLLALSRLRRQHIGCNRFASWHSQVKACSSVEFLLS